MTSYQVNKIKPLKPDITQTIDQILQHHYFNSRLDQIIASKKVHYDTTSVSGLLDDQYYKAEEDVVGEIVDIVHGVVDAQLREVLNNQFINVAQEIEGIKHQMFMFMDQQSKKANDLKNQMNKLTQQMKRRANTSQAMSNTPVINANGFTGGIRFLRSGVSSQIQSSGTISNQNEGKSFHTQLTSLKKQLDDLKQSLQKGQPMKFIEQQFNQFKIETKVAIEALKHNGKKLAVDIGSLAKSSNNAALSSALKQNIEGCVKRTITGQLRAYGNYSDQILSIKTQIENFNDRLDAQANTYHQYLSNQLKSVWLVLNDMKKNLDEVIENVGLNTSREIL